MVIVLLIILQAQTQISQADNPQTPLTQTPTLLTPLPTDQLIIKYKDTAGLNRQQSAARPQQMTTLNQAAGVNLTYFRPMSGEAHVIKLPNSLPEAEVRAITDKLAALPEVEYAEPDRIMQAILTPNDPSYGQQWHYAGPFGINLPEAWDVTLGTNNVIVAVIDTGILTNHPDLAGRTVGGFDFISDVNIANDGNGRDANPSDPGDWVIANECDSGTPARNSTWHGTHVAGTIGAASNNGVGVAGVNWNVRILPIRVLGKCGGFTSDVADGIRWAAGLNVSGVPANANPADVLNLSLGGFGGCGTTYQNAINAARNAGAVVVVAAGNNNTDAANVAPANCNGVVTVAATNDTGNRAGFSNFGNIVEISAPGVNVLSTSNSGSTTPATHNYQAYNGTSMATPHVAGVASLVLSLRPGLSPNDVQDILQTSVTPFPGNSSCNTSTCGSGIVNATAAVRDLYVNKNFSGAELGSSNRPFNRVNEANNVAWNRAWIRVRAGSYSENITFSKQLTVIAEGGTVTIGQ